MEAFRVSKPLREVINSYPDAASIQKAAKEGGEASRVAIARLWLSEGIPFAFKDCPGVYESIRTWLAPRLSVDPKEINVTGSARLGQSLRPGQVGKLFDGASDLDLFVVSNSLFDSMAADFNAWSFQFENGRIAPNNERERGFWSDNIQRVPKLINRGFIDAKLVPNHESFPVIKNIAQSMWMLKAKLDITEDAPCIAYASIRCYKSWNSFVRQVVLSLGA